MYMSVFQIDIVYSSKFFTIKIFER